MDPAIAQRIVESDINSGFFVAMLFVVPAACVVAWLVYRYGWPKVHHVLDLIPVDDEIPGKVSAAISRKVQSANLLNMSVRKARDHIRQLAREAIADAYSEHFAPKVYVVRDDRLGRPAWPDAYVQITTVVGAGTVAVISPWVGHDWDDDRSLETIPVRVQLKPEVIAFRKVVNAPPERDPAALWPTGHTEGKPTLKLTRVVDRDTQAKPAPRPAKPKAPPKIRT